MNPQAISEQLLEKFGSREAFLADSIIKLSQFGTPCDITFYDKPPMLDVLIDKEISLALSYGAGPKRLQQMLSKIRLSNGKCINIMEVWVINPMPVGGVSEEAMSTVDIKDADIEAGQNRETLRKMIADSYHCKDDEETDYYVKRYLAS